jgi:hypothetical protein
MTVRETSPGEVYRAPDGRTTVSRGGDLLLRCHSRGCNPVEMYEHIGICPSALFCSEHARSHAKKHGRKIVGGRAVEPAAAGKPGRLDDEHFARFAVAHAECVARTRRGELSAWVERIPGVSLGAMIAMEAGIDARGKITWPHRDADGRVIGLALRDAAGAKTSLTGSRIGLCMPVPYQPVGDAIRVVESQTSVAALLARRLAAVGRGPAHAPRCVPGWLAEYLRRGKWRTVIVVADRDAAGTGMAGAKALAAQLPPEPGRTVRVVYPPGGHKDVRDAILAGLYVRPGAKPPSKES